MFFVIIRNKKKTSDCTKTKHETAQNTKYKPTKHSKNVFSHTKVSPKVSTLSWTSQENLFLVEGCWPRLNTSGGSTGGWFWQYLGSIISITCKDRLTRACFRTKVRVLCTKMTGRWGNLHSVFKNKSPILLMEEIPRPTTWDVYWDKLPTSTGESTGFLPTINSSI